MPPAPDVVLFVSTIVPDCSGLVLCGIMVNVFPETQYEYFASGTLSVMSVLPEVVYPPAVCGSTDSSPIEPGC